MATVDPEDMLRRAQRSIAQAFELLSDAVETLDEVSPPGTALTDRQVARLEAMYAACVKAKAAITEAVV